MWEIQARRTANPSCVQLPQLAHRTHVWIENQPPDLEAQACGILCCRTRRQTDHEISPTQWTGLAVATASNQQRLEEGTAETARHVCSGLEQLLHNAASSIESFP
jgi:hypothetical protein